MKASVCSGLILATACWPLLATEPVDPDLLAFLGGWELNDEESMTPLEWQQLLDELDDSDITPTAVQNDSAVEAPRHGD